MLLLRGVVPDLGELPRAEKAGFVRNRLELLLEVREERLKPRLLVPQESNFSKMHFRKFCNFLAGSFSAVSKRNFARKYAVDSFFQALQDLHTFAPL